MGYTTDFIGHIEIVPPLNSAEMEYLTAFHESRRYDRGDPYRIPGNPSAEDLSEAPTAVTNAVAPGQPGLWCDWSPCWDGCCITWSGKEKTYRPAAWLRYLIDHFLGPDACAQAAGHPQFHGFSFDHVLSGVVIGCRRDTKEVRAITVEDNRVDEVVLHAADPRLEGHMFLYEEEIDRWARPARPRPKPSCAAIQAVASRFGSPVE